MRKFIIVLMSFCLLLGVLGFGAVSATEWYSNGYNYFSATSNGNFYIPANVTKIDVLLVAGGGGGGAFRSPDCDITSSGYNGGYGGAGGLVLLESPHTYNFSAGELSNGYVSFTIGAGGAGGSTNVGTVGSDSTFGTLTAKGGGAGGYSTTAGGNGGSGGGGGSVYSRRVAPYWDEVFTSGANGGADSQVNQAGASGTYGWGTDGEKSTDMYTAPAYGGGANAQGGAYTSSAGKTVWGTTYSTGNGSGYGSGGSVGSSGGCDDSPVTYEGFSGNGGIVVIRYTAPSYPTITYPAHSATITNGLNVTFTWNDVNTSYTYDIKVGTNPTLSTYNFSDEDLETNSTTFTLVNGKTYYVTLRTKNVSDVYSLWSPITNFATAYYPAVPTFTNPTEALTIEDTLNVTFTWNDVNSSDTYDIKVGTNPTLSTYNFSDEDLETNSITFELENYETYYVSARSKNLGGYYSNWSTIISFDMDYFPSDLVLFDSPANASTVNSLKQMIIWDSVVGASYNIKWSQQLNMASYDSGTFGDEYVVLYLANGDWYFDGRTSIGGEYSDWSTEWIGIHYFTSNNKPTFGLPYSEEYSPYVDFNWTLINQVTNYELEVYSDEALTTRVFFEEPSYNYDTLTMDSGDYWARVRGVDDYVNGSWSDTFAFTVAIEDIPFIYTMNSVNYYGGDTMLYEFSGLDANVTYTFKINKLNDNGTFNSNIATKTVVGNGVGEGSFDYTFSNSAHYPFEVRYDETNSQLFKHFVAVRPSDRFYQAAEHKLNYSDTILAVGAGDVVYNNKSGFLHTNTLPTQCLYEYGDYFLLHYNFEWQVGVKFKILIMDMETGALMATIHSDDLYAFNHELGYAERNFIVVPTDGSTPAIVDDYALLLSYEEDDWNSLELPKGAYAYILIEDSLDNPNLAFGESVILVGDSSTTEWTITPSAASIIEGQKITWTITCNTEGIWDSYKLMRFYDTASDQYYLGTAGSPYYQSYPASYAASFTLNYNTNPALGYSAGAIFGIKPSDVPTDAYQYEYMTFDLASTYGYIVTQGYTITEATDLTEGLDDWLVTVGLGTATGKLILSMALIILLVIVCAALHVPVAGISIVALAAFIAMVAIGFIPIWTTVILGLALVLFMVKLFSGSGGGE